jgi:Holliday junction resolvase RusA-like endonuclease
MEIVFEVPGEPRGKGRPRFIRNTGVTYTPPETRAYEKKIMDCYRVQCRGAYWSEDKFVSVNVTAVYPIPKSATKATRAAIEQGNILPKKKPDIDNVLKIVLDSMNGIAYKDDSQVVMVTGRKLYGEEPKLIIEIHGR